MIPTTWLYDAAQRLEGKLIRTPLTHDEERDLYIKWENQQKTGSFKARGALNRAMILEDWEKEMGLVTASAGNHGQGVALAGQILGASVRVFVPKETPPVKIDAMRAMDATVELVDGGYHAAEEAGLAYAKRNDAVWLSPYNDGHVVAGQGTVAHEILDELPEAAEMTWVVPVSGGGLLSGIAAVVREQAQNALRPGSAQARVIGVQVENAAFMHGFFHHGTQYDVVERPTLADGLAGAVEEGAITISLIRKYVDDILLVSEDEVAEAVAFAWHAYGEKIEAAGAVGLAAYLQGKLPETSLVQIISGGNIQPDLHADIIARYEK